MNPLLAAAPAGNSRRLPQPMRHGVLLTRPIGSQAALQRLHTFFDVEVYEDPAPLARATLLQRLHGKAGVMTDLQHTFDASLVEGLPTLKAVCNLDAGYHNLDLPALTRAGIRATHTPGADAAERAWMHELEQAWDRLQAAAAQARAEAPPEGRYPSRWSRRMVLGPTAASSSTLSVGFAGRERLAMALAEHARSARMAVSWLRGVESAAAPSCEQAPVDLWVWTDGQEPAMRQASPRTPVLDLRARPHDEAVGGSRDDSEEATAEALIAALGFGRNSWHPPHLLNPEISCESCC